MDGDHGGPGRDDSPRASHRPGDHGARYGHIELLRNVDLERVGHLLEACHEVSVDAGDVLLEAGAENMSAYLVVRGALEVRLLDSDAEPLVSVGAGSCVGELSILSRLKVSAYVVATAPSTLLVISDDILWALVASSHEFAANLLSLVSGRVRENNTRLLDSLDAQNRFQHAARIDDLTGLFNRRRFDEVLERQWHRARSDDVPLSLVFIDIDHFKRINDEHGHLVGDQVLRTVARLIQDGIRPVDLAARFGGEEFAVLMLGIKLAEAREIAERLRRDIAGHAVQNDAGELRMTISVGVAELLPEESIAQLLGTADEAMYAAKNAGRNRVAVREVQPLRAASA